MVTRCVCFDVSFARMKELIDARGLQSPEELRACIQFGEKCKLCAPFVERIFESGETEFEITFITDK